MAIHLFVAVSCSELGRDFVLCCINQEILLLILFCPVLSMNRSLESDCRLKVVVDSPLSIILSRFSSGVSLPEQDLDNTQSSRSGHTRPIVLAATAWMHAVYQRVCLVNVWLSCSEAIHGTVGCRLSERPRRLRRWIE